LPVRIGSVASRGPAESKSKPLAYVIAFDSHAVRHNADADSHTDSKPERDANAYRNADPHGLAHSGEVVRPTLTNFAFAALSARTLAKNHCVHSEH
jgi:hypothetical protein